MEQVITNGVKVSVDTYYHPKYSSPKENRVCFGYRVRIQNLNDFTVQLMSRYWLIQDSSGLIKQVEGEGVVGQQPRLVPGQTHAYTSHCVLESTIGKMSGYYIMSNERDGTRFEVEIPEFQLLAPYKMN